MLHVQCPGCMASVYLEDGADPDAALNCRPDGGCCLQDHHHGQAANSCTGDHDGDHGRDNPGCPVCRPIVITVMPGNAQIQSVAGG